MDRALLHSDCTFHIPNMHIRGRICRTNQASNTAFRGFGGPQGMLVACMWMDAVGQKLGIPLHTLQERNMYAEGAVTHFGQKLTQNRMPACWQQVTQSSEYHKRRREVDKFNAATRCTLPPGASMSSKYFLASKCRACWHTCQRR